MARPITYQRARLNWERLTSAGWQQLEAVQTRRVCGRYGANPILIYGWRLRTADAPIWQSKALYRSLAQCLAVLDSLSVPGTPGAALIRRIDIRSE